MGLSKGYRVWGWHRRSVLILCQLPFRDQGSTAISPGQWLFLLAWQSILTTVPSGGYKRFPLPHAAGYKTNDTANSFSAVWRIEKKTRTVSRDYCRAEREVLYHHDSARQRNGALCAVRRRKLISIAATNKNRIWYLWLQRNDLSLHERWW